MDVVRGYCKPHCSIFVQTVLTEHLHVNRYHQRPTISSKKDFPMLQLKWKEKVLHRLLSRRGKSTSNSVLIISLALVVGVLASCGSTTSGQTASKTPTPLAVSSATAPPTPTPTPTSPPTPLPTATPVPTSPAQTPQAAPAILDLQPASMSFLGHRDCPGNGVFVCQARVLSDPANQSELDWTAFTNISNKITFSPQSGALAPGQSVIVNITIPLNVCQSGLFFFQGPVNTHTITWAC